MGTVNCIFIADPRSPMRAVDSVRAVPGKGLEGDRYFDKAGTFSKNSTDDREITLIEAEAIEAVGRNYNVELAPNETRRNLLTRGVALNHLVNLEFAIGNVRLRGLRLCEPCGHLSKLTRPGVKEALVHRGGLRAKILTEGMIHVGDEVLLSSPP